MQGASSAPPAGKWKCASWIAAAATAVAGDQEAVATPAGELERRAEAEEVKAGLLRAWRSGGRHCGDPAPPRGPRSTARPRAHTRPGDARARGARGAGCDWTRAPAASPLARCLLPAAIVATLDLMSPALAPRAAAAAAAAAAASRASARRAPHTEPQHCLPLNSLHATWPSRSLPGSWADPVPGLLRSWGQGLCLRASVYSAEKTGWRDPVLGASGELTETTTTSAKLPGIE